MGLRATTKQDGLSAGCLLIDSSLRPLRCNEAASDILTYPRTARGISPKDALLASKIRSLLDPQANGPLKFVEEFISGRRRYACRAYLFDLNGNGSSHPIVALVLERNSSGSPDFSRISGQFKLTHREQEVVELLLQGLTSKEIAGRMKISPNTVKVFLRLVMVKTGVSTRAGIVGKILTTKPSAPIPFPATASPTLSKQDV